LAEQGTELLGQRLFARGAIEATALAQGLVEQLQRQIAWLANVPVATAFAYFDGANLLEDWGGEPLVVDPLTCIWRAVEANAPAQRVSLALASLGDRILRLHADARLARFDFPKRARAVFDVLRAKPQALAELEASGLIERDVLQKLLYTLMLTRHLDTGQAPLGVTPGPARSPSTVARRKFTPPPLTASRVPLSQPSRPVAAAPAPVTPEASEPEESGERVRADASQTGRFLTREEIEAKLARVEELTHYELLELPVDAAPEQIPQAFSSLARRWHPDRLNPQYTELRDGVKRVFARLTEASRVLGNPATRATYDESLRVSADDQAEQQQVEAVLRAAEAFARAEILVKKKDFVNAEKLARMAYEGDPDQPEYAALFAWISARRQGASEAEIHEAVALLKKAIGNQGNNVKIHYYNACVLKLAGQTAAALREFRHVAERDPSNVEAAREIRLNDLRRSQSQAAASSSSSLFSRFFKR
jgi:curved DNA-binding protein CbpA